MMKIIELHIYGYGKLEDYVIGSVGQLQIFYGENEAGKSTIMSFIHSILFGFPAKQSAEIRYEPKNNPKYGGKIKAFFPDRGVAVIERVKGKAAGDVTVSLEDGTIGGEELLKDLLKRMDKTIFQAIYSFNVHGLQNIHAMKGEELGRYLFSAGTLGTDKLINTESFLTKEMEQRFKPSGKRPLLNEKLNELKEVQASLKIAEQQNEKYSELMSTKDGLAKKIAQLQNEIAMLEQKGIKLREYKRNEKLVIEAATIESKIIEHDPSFFPEDGLNRLEKLDEQLKVIQARLLRVKEKKEHLLNELDKSRPNSELLGMETEIEARIENLPLYDQLKQEKRLLESKLEEITEEISQLNDKLHADFNEENIHEINTSIFIKEQAENIQQTEQRLKDKKLELEADFEEEKKALAELEARAEGAKSELLDEGKRNQLVNEMDLLENKERIQSELNYVADQIEASKSREESEKNRRKKQQKKENNQLLLLGGIFLLVALWGLTNDTWLLAGIGLAGLLFLLAARYKPSDKMPVDDQILSKLLERERALKDALNSQPEGSAFTIRNLLARDEEARLRHRELLIKIEQQNDRFEKVVQQFEAWEADMAAVKRKKAELLKQFGLTETAGTIKVMDAYQLIDTQKQYFRERKRIKESLKKVTESLMEMENSLKMLAERFLHNSNFAPVEAANLLKRTLREAIDQKSRHHELTVKLEEIEEEHSSLQKEELVISQEKKGLLALARTEDEDEFRQKAKDAALVKNWRARLEDINYQLLASGLTDEDRDKIVKGISLEEQIEEIELKIEQSKRELTTQFDVIADVKHKMKVLEEGGIYSELLHKYKQLQHEFAEAAKDWAKFAVAKDLLSRTIDRYKDERLPRMLAKAENFLSILTDGSYVKIIPQLSGSGFLIERNDHMFFEANELSQATAEQVYVSIRLALAAGHFDRYPFPIIIDDSFVNFDHNRTARIIKLLREMSNNNQILIFTCHRHLLDYFTENEIIDLQEKSTNIV
ncbi:DNA double-strand break repair Rad50 ATPase [Mesobacillus boroniphilus JCM 21738]|uniref:DNA double-strand break repair Rad50 ATPase n=2 Tax=Mesobacillus boroniphilus TaxID=308892 RepID=W4RPM8_9BACI|nr:DNA double-strand break repair Rad50 ATPase [Mesobacillus boroniphilus JCM 21738]